VVRDPHPNPLPEVEGVEIPLALWERVGVRGYELYT